MMPPEEWFVRNIEKITLRVVTYLCDKYQDNVHGLKDNMWSNVKVLNFAAFLTRERERMLNKKAST